MSEAVSVEDHINSQEFREWADTLKELIFPETIGELKFGNQERGKQR